MSRASSKNKRVPELRFPEFENDGEWENKAMEEILTIGNGKDYKHLQKGDIPVYGSGGYMLSVNDYLYDGESVCIGRKGTIDKPMFLSGKFWTVDTLFYTHTFKATIPKFVLLLFENIDWLKHNQAGGVPSLSKANIYKIRTVLPQRNEQIKIAACLSSLDDLIAAHEDKLEALRKHKKGLLQNLFPKEGEKVPAYRFPEFKDDEEWVEKRLGKHVLVNPKIDLLPEKFIYIDLESVNNGHFTPKPEIRKENAPSRAQRILKKNDVIFQTVRPYQQNNFHFDIENNYNYVASTGYAQLRYLKSSLFLFYSIHCEEFVGKVMNNSTGSNYPAINSSSLKSISLKFPKKIVEQNKIGNCLKTIDDLIQLQKYKTEQYLLLKKALLQSLFPLEN